LHLPNGELLGKEELGGWIASKSSAAPSSDPTHQAYTSLVLTTLLPAVLSSLYLSPTPIPLTPLRPLPYLSALAASFSAYGQRRERIAEIKRLRGGKVGSRVVLDLEEVERDAVETIEALEVKLKATEGTSAWFGGVA
jgi:hypothetical protein